MLKWLSKNKWLALGLVAIMLFTLLPTNLNWADIATSEPKKEELNTAFMTEEGETEVATVEEVVATEASQEETSEISEEQQDSTDSTSEEVTDSSEAPQEEFSERQDDIQNVQDTDSQTQEGAQGSDNAQAGTQDADDAQTATDGQETDTYTNTDDDSVTVLGNDDDIVVMANGNDLLADAGAKLSEMTLVAEYVDENGVKQTVVLDPNGSYEIPVDARLKLHFQFILPDGNIDWNKRYEYKIPEGLNVDIIAEHELYDDEQQSIGNVTISPDGTLTFEFYEDKVKNQTNTPFFVDFEGGFSSDLEEGKENGDLHFPTGSGSFDYDIELVPSNKNTEPGDLKVYKNGAQVVESDGKKYIRWTIQIDLNGREELSATIRDILPEGLKYVSGSASINQNNEEKKNSANLDVTYNESTRELVFDVDNLNPYDWTYSEITFLTEYDESIFEGSNVAVVNNSVTVEPDNEPDKPATGTGTVRVSADVLEKTGTLSSDGKTIDWKVTLNQDRFDIAGSTYTDTIGEGHKLTGEIKVNPSEYQKYIQEDGNGGFTLNLPDDIGPIRETITIEYTTEVTNGTQSGYNNKGKLTGGITAETDKTVNGVNYLRKDAVSYDSNTKEFTWTITVNESELDLYDVVIEDLFDTSKMELSSRGTSIVVKDANGRDYSCTITGNKISLGHITGKIYITITTRLKESYMKTLTEGQWDSVRNQAKMTWDGNDKGVEDDAWQSFEYKKSDLIDKYGELQKGGTIKWTIVVKKSTIMPAGRIVIEDTLPEGMEYVAGSFHIQRDRYWWDGTTKDGSNGGMYIEPVWTNGGRSFTLTIDNSFADRYYLNPDKDFVIIYETKLKDYKDASESKSYTNQASAKVTDGNNLSYDDTAESTVTGKPGGTLDKKYAYKSGDNFVEWTVVINEAGFDMSEVLDPVIRDQLEEYFTYVSGTLYKIENGQRKEVSSGDYTVSVINNLITVQLPNIGSDTYEFVFTAQFNVISDSLLPETIKNSVNFTGTGHSEEVTSNDLKNASFSSSSAGSTIKRELRIFKVDATSGQKTPLNGAVFELFDGDVSLGTVTTGDDGDGRASFSGILSFEEGGNYTLREIQPPENYVITGNGEYPIQIKDWEEDTVTGARYFELVVENSPTTTEPTRLYVYKTDGKNPLANAEFALFSDENCKTQVGAAKKTGPDGLVYFSVDYDEEKVYYIMETNSPPGYVYNADEALNKKIKVTVHTDGTVDYEPNGVTVGGGIQAATATNDKAKASLRIHKVEKGNTATYIVGATFAIYSDKNCQNQVGEIQTTADGGYLTFTDLEPGVTYYYRELSVPSPYQVDSTIHEITIGDRNVHENVSVTVDVENTKALGNLAVLKTDDSNPANPLSGVTFALYNADDTPVLRNGVQYTVTTGPDGKAVFTDLPFGTYVVKETSGKAGYVEVTTGTTVTINSTGTTQKTIINKKIRFSIAIVKTDDTPQKNPLAGVTFGLYYKDTGKLVISDVTNKEITGRTDDKGQLKFTDIPYYPGGYVLKEMATPAGYNKLDDVDITVAEMTNGKVITYNLENHKQSGSIKFYKQDGTDKNLLAGAKFTIYDENGLPRGTAVSNNAGEVIFENLTYGTYTIRETQPPTEDYVLDNTIWTVEVKDDSTITLPYSGTQYKEVNGSKYALVDNIEKPTSYEYLTFKLQKWDSATAKALGGARFMLSKKLKSEDDTKWKEIATAVSLDDNGEVHFYNIGIGDDKEDTLYKIEEVEAPTGYKWDAENHYCEIYEYGELTELVADGGSLTVGHDENKRTEADFGKLGTLATINNEPKLGEIRLTKYADMGTQNRLQGAEFTLYQEDGKTPYPNAANPYKVTTDANGMARFKDLPMGYYVVKETGAPDGYSLNTIDTPSVEITMDAEEKIYEVFIHDNAFSISIDKVTTDNSKVIGARLAIYDTSGNRVEDPWYTDGNPHVVKNTAKLKAGSTYILRELEVPPGYVKAADVQFTINSDGSLSFKSGDGSVRGNTVIMQDKSIGSLSIRKEDGNDTGLPGALIQIIDEKTGEVVYEFTSDGDTATIPSEYLTAPTTVGGYNYYTIHEQSSPDDTSYQLAEDIRFAVDYYGKIHRVTGTTMSDIPNPVIMTDEEKQDFYFAKVDAATGNPVVGARLSITYADGSKVGDGIEWDSETTPYNVPLDPGTYVLKEIKTPEYGYKQAEEIEFSVNELGKITITKGDSSSLHNDKVTISMKDERIVIKVRKINENQAILPGATFDLYEADAQGNKISAKLLTFTTTDQPTTLTHSKLKLDTYYLLVETKAPKGYVIEKPMLFYVNQDGNLEGSTLNGEGKPTNEVRFKDGVRQFTVQKVGVNDQPLVGVKLKITSKDGEIIDEWSTDGSPKIFYYTDFEAGKVYTLSEEATVMGYTYAASIDFMIGEEDDELYVDGEKVALGNIVMKNEPIEVYISKQSLTTGEDLTGATLVVKNANGIVVDEWVSDGSPHKINYENLQISEEQKYIYTLSETEAPEMYALAQPIEFYIDKDGNVQRVDEETVTDNTVVMYDDFKGLTISKQDMAGNEVPGATLTITCEDDPTFSLTWLSTDTAMNLDMALFERNKEYTLTETAAPDGYAYAESIVFWIDDDGVVYVNGVKAEDQTVVMKDAVLKMSVAKRNAKTSELLSGATLSIIDEASGTTMDTWVTDGTVKDVTTSGLKASKGDSRTMYILRETQAPNGYVLAADIRFYMNESGNVYTVDANGNATQEQDNIITMYDEESGEETTETTTEVTTETTDGSAKGATKEDEYEDEDEDEDEDETGTKTATKTDSKKTGDDSPIAMAGVLLFLSLTGVGATVVIRRRKKK